MTDHLKHHHALPQVETLAAVFPDISPLDTPEPSSFYLLALERQYCYEKLNQANLDTQTILKQDQNASDVALEVFRHTIRDITEQRYRVRILDVALDAPELVLKAYHHTTSAEYVAMFGWPWTCSGGVMPGDVISFWADPPWARRG